MKLILQRVKHAQVEVQAKIVGKIDQGLLVFLGVAEDDSSEDVRYLVDKIIQLRIFDDAQGKMNLSVVDLGGSVLVVSQFTLYGDCRKGRRPSFDQAAAPAKAEQLYNEFVELLRQKKIDVATGQFKAMMDVSLINDGPVTFILES
ncbi:MAG: D-tyrosyl-tRNA(Tyr) deacylase [Candidatus Omnitrophica bacterium]|nr:D-tyrosyl-tRNA(Tyr) deacylase [Candidatus Omnitrophota bacterium]